MKTVLKLTDTSLKTAWKRIIEGCGIIPPKEIVCHFCKTTFFGYGHSLTNVDASCCDVCNINIVLPDRMLGIHH